MPPAPTQRRVDISQTGDDGSIVVFREGSVVPGGTSGEDLTAATESEVSTSICDRPLQKQY